MKAYALLRLPNKDIPLTTKEAYLGRDPQDLETELAKSLVTNSGGTAPSKGASNSKIHIKLSDSKRLSKTAAKLYLDSQTDLFTIKNLSKNTIMVDRHPLLTNESRPLFHRSLIQIGD
jgi:hypothetical protein